MCFGFVFVCIGFILKIIVLILIICLSVLKLYVYVYFFYLAFLGAWLFHIWACNICLEFLKERCWIYENWNDKIFYRVCKNVCLNNVMRVGYNILPNSHYISNIFLSNYFIEKFSYAYSLHFSQTHAYYNMIKALDII